MSPLAAGPLPPWLVPEWEAPRRVRALATTRAGGVSAGAYAGLNLGAHVGDMPAAVAANRRALAPLLPAEPLWLEQVHGTRIVGAEAMHAGRVETADASVARSSERVLVVLHADCLPILFCDTAGSVIAAAHAGWRGLAAGVIEQTVAAMQTPAAGLLAWLGVAISEAAYEVGAEVRDAFLARDRQADLAFRPQGVGRWRCDLYTLARQRLAAAGVTRVFGGGLCTHGEPERFFSHRRDGVTGRMATLIWLAG